MRVVFCGNWRQLQRFRKSLEEVAYLGPEKIHMKYDPVEGVLIIELPAYGKRLRCTKGRAFLCKMSYGEALDLLKKYRIKKRAPTHNNNSNKKKNTTGNDNEGKVDRKVYGRPDSRGFKRNVQGVVDDEYPVSITLWTHSRVPKDGEDVLFAVGPRNKWNEGVGRNHGREPLERCPLGDDLEEESSNHNPLGDISVADQEWRSFLDEFFDEPTTTPDNLTTTLDPAPTVTPPTWPTTATISYGYNNPPPPPSSPSSIIFPSLLVPSSNNYDYDDSNSPLSSSPLSSSPSASSPSSLLSAISSPSTTASPASTSLSPSPLSPLSLSLSPSSSSSYCSPLFSIPFQ